jgi:hypothetical protein
LCSEADTIGDGKANCAKKPEADFGLKKIQPKMTHLVHDRLQKAGWQPWSKNK